MRDLSRHTLILIALILGFNSFSSGQQTKGIWGSIDTFFNYTNIGQWQQFQKEYESVHLIPKQNLVLDLCYADSLEVEFLFEGEGGMIDSATYFFSDRNGFDSRKAQSPQFVLPIDQDFYGDFVVNISLKHARKAKFPVYIEHAKSTASRSYILSIFFWAIFSAIAVIILYNLFLYIGVLERIYIFYVASEITILFTQASNYGFSFQFLWPQSYILAKYGLNIFVFLSGVASLQFFIELLDTKRNYPLFNRIAVFIRGLYFIAILPIFWDKIDESYMAISAIAGMLSLFALFVAYRIWVKGIRTGMFFLIAWSVFLIGLILYIGKDFGFFPYNRFTLYTMPFGAALETVLLSFALADRINVLKKEKEASQARAINQMRRNQIMINEQNKLLEEKVKQRTAELEEINQELSSTIQNLKTTQTQLVDAEKMASLGQLTAGIAHEINNPINFVSSNIEPLQQDFTDLKTVLMAYRELHEQSEEAREKLQEVQALEEELDIDYALHEIDELLKGIKEGANRTIDIVKSLRIFSRSEEKGIKAANLNEGLQSTLTILKSQMKNIELVFEPSDLPMVYGQIGRLNQVFMNVITNAIQAINQRYQGKPGGRLTVKSLHQNDEVVIQIGDNGDGIPDHVIKKIFEPFFTTKDVGQGTGLGLSISYGIIEDHRGTIEVESEKGKGSNFVLHIPVNSDARRVNSNAQT